MSDVSSREWQATASVECGGFRVARDGARSHRQSCKGRCAAKGERRDDGKRAASERLERNVVAVVVEGRGQGLRVGLQDFG